MHPQLLAPGESAIRLFADGSFVAECETGTWAYRIPAFSVERHGIACAGSVEYFELAAVLEGLMQIDRLDRTTRPVAIRSDSSFVIAVLKYLAQGSELPARKSFNRVRSLAGPFLSRRPMTFGKPKHGCPEHRNCHKRALTALREHVRGEPLISHAVALSRQRSRLAMLQRERDEISGGLSDWSWTSTFVKPRFVRSIRFVTRTPSTYEHLQHI